MAVARETVGLGLSARSQSKLKVRQPLRAAVVVAADRERAALDRLGDVVREELNVKEIRYVAQADELGSYEIKPNYRALGPALRQGDAAGGRGGRRRSTRRTSPRALREGTAGRPQHRRPRPRPRPRRPLAGHEAARGLPARARGLTRGGARARARRRAAPRGARARGRPRGAERAQVRRPRGRGPDRAAARRRRRTAGRRARARGLRHRRGAGHVRRLRATATRHCRHDRGPRAADRRSRGPRRAPARARPRGAAWASRPGCAWPPGRCGTAPSWGSRGSGSSSRSAGSRRCSP